MTIFTNLAVSVFCGVIFTALNFAWTEGKHIGFVGDDQNGLTAGTDSSMSTLSEEEQAAIQALGLQDGAACPEFPTDEEKVKAAMTLGLTAKNWKALANCAESRLVMRRQYDVEGTLFFAATSQFVGLFTPEVLDSCPKYVTLRFRHGEIADFSAIEALRSLAGMFKERGKTLNLTELSPSSKRMIDKGKSHIEEVEYEEADVKIEADVLSQGTTGLHVENMGNLGASVEKEKRP